MKRITTIIVLFLAVITLSAQDISGKWAGKLSITDQMGQTMELRIVFNISASENGYATTLDSPDQNSFGNVVDTTIFKKPELTVRKAAFNNLVYTGTQIDKSTINGTLTQGGQSLDLNLKKEE